MDQGIIDLFPVTKDADLINKYFGKDFDKSYIFTVLAKGKEKEMIEYAKKLEKDKAKTNCN